MKKILILIMFILFIYPILFSESVVLDEIFNPSSIKIEKDRIFIVQDTDVFIYSAKDFKLLKKFGKKGSGPREFQKSPVPWIPSLTLYTQKDNLFINSTGKVSFFSKSGVFKKEIRTTGIGRFGRYIPNGENYILIKYMRIEKINYSVSYLTDSSLKEIKELYRVKFPQQAGKKRNPILMAKMADYFDRYSYNNNFVIPNETGEIYIFDKTSKKIVTFKPEYTKRKITKEFKKELDNYFSNHTIYKRPYLQDKSRGLMDFGKALPLFNTYRLSDDKIYIISNFKKDNNYETFVYDFNGKLTNKFFLPLNSADVFSAVPFDIYQGKLYQLVYDEENEEMKLIINNI